MHCGTASVVCGHSTCQIWVLTGFISHTYITHHSHPSLAPKLHNIRSSCIMLMMALDSILLHLNVDWLSETLLRDSSSLKCMCADRVGRYCWSVSGLLYMKQYAVLKQWFAISIWRDRQRETCYTLTQDTVYFHTHTPTYIEIERYTYTHTCYTLTEDTDYFQTHIHTQSHTFTIPLVT